MRLTVLNDDPDRKINPCRKRYRIFLDGKEIKRCFTTDDEKGEVIEAVTGERDRMIAGNGEVKRRIRNSKAIIKCIS